MFLLGPMHRDPQWRRWASILGMGAFVGVKNIRDKGPRKQKPFTVVWRCGIGQVGQKNVYNTGKRVVED